MSPAHPESEQPGVFYNQLTLIAMSSRLEIEFLRNGHFLWSLILFYCAPVSTCITSLLDMAINVN